MNDKQPPVFIIVAGLAGSGKTSFIAAVSDANVAPVQRTIDRAASGYRLHYDYGQIVVDSSLIVRLLAPPASRDLALARQLPADTLGVILTVNSVDTESFAGAEALIAEYRRHASVPCLVAATMQDLPGALSPEALRACLNVPDAVPIVSCRATDTASATAVVIRLLHLLIDRIEGRL